MTGIMSDPHFTYILSGHIYEPKISSNYIENWKLKLFAMKTIGALTGHYNRACHPGGHYWDYYPDTLS